MLGWEGGECEGKRRPETQSDTSGHDCWVENPKQVTRGWGQGLAAGREPKDMRPKIPGWNSLQLAVGLGAG